MIEFMRLLVLALLTLGLLSCSPKPEPSLPPEYEGDIEFSLPVEPGQVSKWNTTFSVRTSYFLNCDIPSGYRLPDDLYWEYDPGYLSVYRGDWISPSYFMGPFEEIGNDLDCRFFTVIFSYPGETSIAIKRGEETLFSLDVRIIDGTVTPLGFEETHVDNYDGYLVVESGDGFEPWELPKFARDDDYFANNLLLFVNDSDIEILGYPFIIGENFYLHFRTVYNDPYWETNYFVMGLPKSYFANPKIHYSVACRYIPSLHQELD